MKNVRWLSKKPKRKDMVRMWKGRGNDLGTTGCYEWRWVTSEGKKDRGRIEKRSSTGEGQMERMRCRTIRNQLRRKRRLVPLEEVPGHLEDTLVHVTVGEVREQRRRHVEGSRSATRALVGDGSDGGLAGGGVGDLQSLTTVTAIVGLVLGLVKSDNEVRVGVGPSAGTLERKKRKGSRTGLVPWAFRIGISEAQEHSRGRQRSRWRYRCG